MNDVPYLYSYEKQPWLVINLDEYKEWHECLLCGEWRRLNYAVAYYCGPTHDEIGSVTTEYTDGGIVGGMICCKECHDNHYNMGVGVGHKRDL